MSNARILVVDDDVEVCRIIDRMLFGQRYQVKMVPSVAAAVAEIEQEPFDLYVLDFNLADGTGLDVAGLIRSKGSEAPIILLSGCDPATIALSAAKFGIAEIIQKPFSRMAIFSAWQQALGVPRVALT
jgi:DNA-binding NtrC family response regulator